MSDLVLAYVVLLGLTLLALMTGFRGSRRWSRVSLNGAAVLAVAGLLLFAFCYHGTWQIARLLPYSNAIVLGNWIPIGGGFLAGLALGQETIPVRRRRGLAILILALSVYSVACCPLGHLVIGQAEPPQSGALQQNWRSSCGACCAALLLECHGIEASEPEMVRLCLTSPRGSPALGLYRGLKLKTAGTAWDVEVVTCGAEQLLEQRGPLLVRERLPAFHTIGVRPQSWQRRPEHAVLLLGASDSEHIRILDPAAGIDQLVCWRMDDLRERWQGEALRLVPRSGQSATGLLRVGDD